MAQARANEERELTSREIVFREIDRLNTAVVYCRSYIQTQERIREGATPEMLERNPPRFADLMGVNNFLGFDREGPDLQKAKALKSRFG